MAVANKCWKDNTIRRYLTKKVASAIKNELVSMCSDGSNSVLKNTSAESIKSFRWKMLIEEMKLKAPLLLELLQMCASTKKPRKNKEGIIGMCTAILLKHRRKSMCIIQKVISLILYAGHSSKRVSRCE